MEKKDPLRNRRTVVVNESFLNSLVKRKDLTSQFSFLSTIRDPNPLKSCCARSGRHKSRVYQGVKLSIAGLSEKKMTILKQRIKADTLIIFIRQPSGKVQRVER